MLFFCFICVPVRLFTSNHTVIYHLATFVSKVAIWLIWHIVGIKYEIEGLEKLPKNFTPHLVLANHQSFWDNFFSQVILPEHSWVVKKELYNIPFLGWVLKMTNPIAVDRQNIRSLVQIIEKGKAKLDSGLSLMVFPEGTRVSPRRTVKFKTSAAKLAMDAKVPVLLFVHNAGIYWPKGLWMERTGTIRVKILEIISPEEVAKYDVRSLTQYIETRLNSEKQILVKETIAKKQAMKRKKRGV